MNDPMTRDDIMNAIATLAQSQGSYGRLLESLNNTKENEPDKYDKFMTHLEEQSFHDTVDMVMYLET